MKIICLATLLIIASLFVHGQQRGYSKKGVSKTRHSINNSNNEFDPILFRMISNLKYDSVKVYNINCELKDIKPLSISADTLDTYLRKYASTDSISMGKLLIKNDVIKLVTLLKRMHKDNYQIDPIGYFFPAMGVVFFKNKKPVGNIDYSNFTSGMTIHITDNNYKTYNMYWSVTGMNLFNYFKMICTKYDLECCKNTKN